MDQSAADVSFVPEAANFSGERPDGDTPRSISRYCANQKFLPANNPNPLTVGCRILDNLLDSQPYDHKTKLLSVDDSGRPLALYTWRAREPVKSAIDSIPGRRSHAMQVRWDEMAHADRTGQCLSRGQN
jgi:hypothetical protein